MAFRRPDGRWFIRSPDDDEPGVDLYATTDDNNVAAYTRRGFVIHRRENHYLVPTRTVGQVDPPAGVELVTADRVEEERLRELDDELRQDVPGTEGWRWDANDFRAEMAGADFDPSVYIVAAHGADYIGIARIWMRRPVPRLGFVGVARPYRRRGVALALLSRGFGVLASRGIPEVTTEIDETNAASRRLLEGLGARKVGGTVRGGSEESVHIAAAPRLRKAADGSAFEDRGQVLHSHLPAKTTHAVCHATRLVVTGPGNRPARPLLRDLPDMAARITEAGSSDSPGPIHRTVQ